MGAKIPPMSENAEIHDISAAFLVISTNDTSSQDHDINKNAI